MEFLTELWLPILLSAVAVFFLSSVLHMMLPLHKSDYKPLANEEAVLASMREHGVQPGEFMFPHCADMKEYSSPEMTAKFEQGPVGMLTVLPPGSWTMGKSLSQWFAMSLIISAIVAYLTHIAYGGRPEGAEPTFNQLLQMAGASAFLGYAGCTATNSIWKGVAWSTTAKFVFDGLLYGIATGLIFAFLG